MPVGQIFEAAIKQRLSLALRPLVLLLALLGALNSASAAPSFETVAPTAVLVDHDTHAILFDKNADERYPPASLAKLMTVELLFRELKEGRISLDDEFPVSERAWREGGAQSGGSTMFLPVNSSVSVRDLIRGIVIQSGNDATIVVAEALGGTEEKFAEQMTERAKALGMTDSTFRNSHGLPDPEQRVTMRDLAVLASHLIREYPEFYKYFGEEEFTYNEITQRNRNPLLDMGADGLKTGYTSEAGYGLVASVERDSRRLIVAVGHLSSASARTEEARKLVEWGFRSFENRTLHQADDQVGEMEVLGGAAATVPVVVRSGVVVTVPRGAEDLHTILHRDEPLQAPVAEGDRVGWLQVVSAGDVIREDPVHAAAAVEPASFVSRTWGLATSYLWSTWDDTWAFVFPPKEVASTGSP
ncbi:D-alanyl-D-alanine carboxypeptidase family protein [Microvirga lenta]|uniref:D-alanyl-D-alanine carboxypeptidase family protein n=1 Tax=Microvirga lenta TaxID=2881337 RepID=UPI001CFFD53B|nr:D-alanyl-D-alanine carboxypeptidase family protein [Microvirga lenta]MCB5177527.1 D-alanyl-D-alanine carboxypeptidase [Microvirga lenta]